MIETEMFRKAKIKFEAMEKYGFVKMESLYVLEKPIMNGDFKAVIKVDKDGNISGNVYDTDTGDEYALLRVEEMAIGFAGEVREAYKKILEDIKCNCCTQSYFGGKQANRIAEKLIKIYGDTPEFLWEKYDDYGVFRNSRTAKWYALFGKVDYSKLDKKRNGDIEIVNVKADKEKIPQLLQENGFYPAYHMNKKSWITMVLDESIEDEKILALLAESYNFSLAKKKQLLENRN